MLFEHFHESAVFSLGRESAHGVLPFTICKENGQTALRIGTFSVLDVGLGLVRDLA